jgi:hypothetical protein
MKIRAEVLSVESIGDALRVKLQGSADGEAQWRPMLSLTVELPDQVRCRRNYYVGRHVTIRVDAGP